MILNSTLKPSLCNCAKNSTAELETSPQQLHKWGLISLFHLTFTNVLLIRIPKTAPHLQYHATRSEILYLPCGHSRGNKMLPKTAPNYFYNKGIFDTNKKMVDVKIAYNKLQTKAKTKFSFLGHLVVFSSLNFIFSFSHEQKWQ